MTTQDRILIVGEEEDIALSLCHYLQAHGAAVTTVADPETAFQEATAHLPDIILLAVAPGGPDGLEFFRRLRRKPRTAPIPVMFIIGFNAVDHQNELLAAGVDDVITRPFDVEIFGLRIRNAIQRSRREGRTDSVTGLPTGRLLEERLAALRAQPGWCVLTVRLAHFDALRAHYDFITGNEVLRYAAGAILELVEQGEIEDGWVGYPAEAEYVALVPCDQAPALAAALESRLQAGVRQFYTFAEREQGFLQREDGPGGTRRYPLIEVQVSYAG
jgi:PleD family two-component response regulator